MLKKDKIFKSYERIKILQSEGDPNIQYQIIPNIRKQGHKIITAKKDKYTTIDIEEMMKSKA